MSNIKNIILQIVKPLIKPAIIKGKVDAIDEDKLTCTVLPLNGDAKLYGVQLRAKVEDNPTGILAFPKVGSDVLVGFVNDNEADAFIAQVSEIDKLQIVDASGTVTLEINANGISLGSKDASSEHVPLGESLVQQLEIQSAKVDAIINALTNAATAPTDGGATYKAGIVALVSTLQSPNYSNVLSDKITLD